MIWAWSLIKLILLSATKFISSSLFVCCLSGTLRRNICTKFLGSPESVEYIFNSCYGGSRYYLYLVCVSSSSSSGSNFIPDRMQHWYRNRKILCSYKYSHDIAALLHSASGPQGSCKTHQMLYIMCIYFISLVLLLWIFPNSVFIVGSHGSVSIDAVTNESWMNDRRSLRRIFDASIVCLRMFDEVKKGHLVLADPSFLTWTASNIQRIVLMLCNGSPSMSRSGIIFLCVTWIDKT